MKYQIISGLAAALLVPALSPTTGQAQTPDPVLDTTPAAAPEQLLAEQSFPPEATEATPSSPDSLVAVSEAAPSLSQVISHSLDETQAATLYLRDIPLLTFVGGESAGPDSIDKAEDSGTAAVTATDPAVRANAFADQIDEMYQAGIDAETISARWGADDERFEVMVGDTVFVVLNDQVTLPDATGNIAEDTLQVTNRLRRLLGNVEPLTEIEGRPAPEPAPQTVAVRSVSSGMASWYGPGFHGRRSASGEVFNQNAMTAAHRYLPFGTRVRVTNLNNGRQVVVRINDRGPFSGGRVIDLSAGAAGAIGLRSAGVGPVQLEVLGN
ncbi:MAG: septal ring lytic transglycosylase RlpA family protein [Cyanobacteria bacterium J06648_16]